MRSLPIALAVMQAAAPAASAQLVTTWMGATVQYEVVDGMAVAGDVILGPAAEVAAPPPRAKQAEAIQPRAAAVSARPRLWPNATIPYTLDPELQPETRDRIARAFDEWHSRTVIRLIPRTGEEDYVRFDSVPDCASHVGRVGGEQLVWVGSCGTAGAFVHEIGHVVGLHHEHQRTDRNERIMIPPLEAEYDPNGVIPAFAPPLGPYDYASVMHYDLSQDGWDSIPPGIPFNVIGDELSDGDADAVARLYGAPASRTTVSTNPPGLTILVDGIATTTPASFDWPAGSTHTLAAPAQPQVEGNTRYVFARWEDGSGNVRSVRADPERTLLAASFIQQRSAASGSAGDPSIGAAELEPRSPDGWYTVHAEIQATAFPSDPTWRHFLYWSSGQSSNPTTLRIRPADPRYDWPLPPNPYFSWSPPVRIASTTGGAFSILVDGTMRTAPWEFRTERPDAPNPIVSVPPVQVHWLVDPRIRLRFDGWTDGVRAAQREVDRARDAGKTLRVRFKREYTAWIPDQGPRGQVLLDPQAEGDWYPSGTIVTATAEPADGYEFVRWDGDVDPSESLNRSRRLVLDAPHTLRPVFERVRERLLPAAPAKVSIPGTPTSARGHLIAPHPRSGQLVITLSAPDNPAANVDLYVKAVDGQSQPGTWGFTYRYRSWGDGLADEADFRSENPGNSERIEISADSDPPLDPEADYYVTLVVDGYPRDPVDAELRLEETLRTGPDPPRAAVWPRALTFVTPFGGHPLAQTVRLSNEGGSPMRFRAPQPRAIWIAAAPAEGVVAPGEAVDIAVQARPIGVAAGTYTFPLAIELADAAGNAAGTLEVPVTMAAYHATPESGAIPPD